MKLQQNRVAMNLHAYMDRKTFANNKKTDTF